MKTLPKVRVRLIDNVATHGVNLGMIDERRDQSWNSLFVHVDDIVINLDEDRFGVEAVQICP